ncbi:MAG: DUF6152 family protein, partial [Terriglobia bacterium]
SMASACLGIAIFAGSVLAHHSAAMFDGTKLVVLKGSMVSFTNMNPHGWISIDAKVNGIGKTDRRDVEATSPGQLLAIGIKSDALKLGDKVTAGIRPLRDGRHAGSMVFVITADGDVHGAKLSELGLDFATLKP